jgi:hypothetical protein
MTRDPASFDAALHLKLQTRHLILTFELTYHGSPAMEATFRLRLTSRRDPNIPIYPRKRCIYK